MDEADKIAVVDHLIARVRDTVRESERAEVDVEQHLRDLYRRMGLNHEPAPVDQSAAGSR